MNITEPAQEERTQTWMHDWRLCRRCILGRYRRQIVFGRHSDGGNAPRKADLFFVGEAPGKSENLRGLAFVGPSGRILSEAIGDALRAVGAGAVPSISWYSTNVVSCFSGMSSVQLGGGSYRTIGSLFRKKYRGDVLSFDIERRRFVPRRVISIIRSRLNNRRWVKVSYKGAKNNGRGSTGVVCTNDHRFLTQENKWVRADCFTKRTRINIGPEGLGSRAFDVVVGSLLGDGTIGKNRACLVVGHCEAQREWIECKARVFGSIVKESIIERCPTKLRRYYRMSSLPNRHLFELRTAFYSTGTKHVPVWIPEKMSAQILSVWFLDDGHMRMRKNRRSSCSLATNAFNQNDLKILIQAISKLDLKSDAQRGRIIFNVENSRKLAQIIAPYVPTTMRYKLGTWESECKEYNSSLWDYDPGVARFAEPIVLEPAETYKLSDLTYCLEVDETSNFVTHAGVVHNCRPCDGPHMPNREPTPEEAWACWPRLEKTLDFVSPSTIIFLGKVAEVRCRKAWPDATALQHPAYILRCGGTRSPEYRRFVRDLSVVFEGVLEEE